MRAIGEGGMPIGLIPGATYEAVSIQLLPGDRLFLVSDGVTDRPDPNGSELSSDGLQVLLHRSAHLPTPRLLEALIWDLSAF